MGIKEILQQQDMEFISLHDLLLKMTEVENVSLQEAATVLFRLLDQENSRLRPTWQQRSQARGVTAINGYNSDPMHRLLYVADKGGWEWSDDTPF